MPSTIFLPHSFASLGGGLAATGGGVLASFPPPGFGFCGTTVMVGSGLPRRSESARAGSVI